MQWFVKHAEESFLVSHPVLLRTVVFSLLARLLVYALVSGKPRTPIPGECGALAGDFSGFGLSLLPRYAGFSTAFGTIIGERGP